MVDKAKVNKLPADIKAEWVKRLRDGRPQIQHELEYRPTMTPNLPDAGQCCLGVLSEIAAEKGVVTREVRGNGSVSYSGETGQLHPLVIKWLGWDKSNTAGRVIRPESDEPTNLATLNDSGATFEDIADIIVEQL